MRPNIVFGVPFGRLMVVCFVSCTGCTFYHYDIFCVFICNISVAFGSWSAHGRFMVGSWSGPGWRPGLQEKNVYMIPT